MRPQGVDISEHQAAYQPQPHHSFFVLRASQGMIKDKRLEQHEGESASVPVRAPYHYLRSWGIADKYFWQRQADLFLTITAPYQWNFYMMDFEKYGNTPSLRFADHARQFIEYVERVTSKLCLLYTNPSVYQEWLIHYGQRWMVDRPLFIAQYPFRGWHSLLENVIDGDWEPRLPALHRGGWLFWQYSADGNRKGPENGVPRSPWHLVNPSVDLDVFNGTLEQLQAL